ncbi:hypothetical protein [Jiella pacifica]|uniref:hypothetical protein n=1 Tax=Jiella pacifica TaxID=2696469 RepID=UPI001FEBA0BA|nr:hypothetical protein [Jiella pacifica]
MTGRRGRSRGDAGSTTVGIGHGAVFGRRPAADDRRDPARQPAERRAEASEWAEAVEVPPAETTSKPQDLPMGRRIAAMPGRIGLVVCAFAFGALLLPVFLVSFPETPVAATVSNGGGYPVRLSTINASLVSHGDGRLLRVEGRISNPAAIAAAVPPLRIDFADRSAGLRSRTLQTSVDHLSAGTSIDFVTMIAVPEEAKGEVRVGFVGTSREGSQ